MSSFPGKNLSGILTAYRTAPVMYRTPMSMSQPRAPSSTDRSQPFLMPKWVAGAIPLKPKVINTAALSGRNLGPEQLHTK